ncbi:7753_t:CDS:2, partial [Dentiscutata heterogama]
CEVPLTDHGAVVSKFLILINDWDDQLLSVVEEDLILESSYCTADLTIRPSDLPLPHPGREPNSSGVAYPTMVIEVGTTETISSLHDLSARYFSSRTTIQIYLAIKLFPIRQDHTRAMLVMHFLLNNIGVPDANITGVGRFNAIAYNDPRIPNYQLNIPAAELYNGTPNGIPPDAVDGIDLDLWKIQKAALHPYH